MAGVENSVEMSIAIFSPLFLKAKRLKAFSKQGIPRQYLSVLEAKDPNIRINDGYSANFYNVKYLLMRQITQRY